MAMLALPGAAQVERAIVEAVYGDIDCLPCAATIELALRKVPGVDKIAVSMEKQMVAVTFKPDATFDPKAIRDGIAKAEVRIQTIHLAARGKAQKEGDKVFLVAGKNRFLVANPAKVPTDVPLGVMGVLDDSKSPFQITLDDFKPQ
jgi:copper chaperone CopZ